MTSLCRIAVILLAIAALAACKKDPETAADTDAGAATTSNADAASAAPAPQIIFKDGPKPSDDTVIASAGDVSIDWADYQHAVRVGRLFGPTKADGSPEEITKETLATPHLQVMMSRSLLSRKYVSEAAEQRGIEITDDEIKAALQANNRLNRWAKHYDEPEKMKAELEKIGVSVEDFKRIGREQVAQEKMQQALVDDIEADTLWDAYRYENNTVRIIGASTLNIPSSEELDEFTETKADEIEKYFEENKVRYTYPKRAQAIVLVAKPESADRKVLEAAQKDLAAPDADPEAVAAKHGLEAQKELLMTKPEDEALFGAKVGESGVSWQTPRGSYVWKKTADVPPEPRELSFGLKREIAASIIRETRVTDEASAKLAEAEKVLRDAEIDFGNVEREDVEPLLEQLKKDGFEAQLTPEFPRAQNGFIPGFGIHEELAIAAFNATKDSPYPPAPIRSRDKAFTFRLVGRNEPSKADFEKDKKEFAEQFKMRARMGIVDKFVQDHFTKEKPEFNFDPVHTVYGEIHKAER